MELQEFIDKYNADFLRAFRGIKTFERSGNEISFFEGVNISVTQLRIIQSENRRAYIVGNGGSAGIASHTSVDFWKNGGIPTQAFNDTSLLTCLANDIGFEEVFSKPIEMFARKGDLVICISSSGNSANIINACKKAIDKGCYVITLSGFDEGNKLKPLGHTNFFVPAFSYGFVEVLHQYILHTILDAKMYCFDKTDVFNKNMPGASV
jgi:D-sedoheptulose 7-phosphate isomerase